LVREYVVVSRDLQWPVLTDGVRWGPYLSGSVAEASAISLAKLYFKTGRPASVTVEGDLDKIVYSATAGDRGSGSIGKSPNTKIGVSIAIQSIWVSRSLC
jgi:hypothetical protein